ncbi:MAG: ABC transporter ATP-binding protein [Tissierellaceae bacterium]|nr:ABC transporter ATP-binding protein [Tissierellaceae bacterium]
MDNILEVKNLNIDIVENKSTKSLVENVSFNVKRKGSLGIVGESGCGKSITAMSIMQLLSHPLKATKGKIIFNDGSKSIDMREANSNIMRKIRGKEISMIFQEPMTALDPLFTIEEQIAEVLKFHTDLKKVEMKKLVLEMLTKVGIPQPQRIMKNYPHQLSGGMLQRVVISMALILNPKLIIADEPTTALDVTIQAQILELINDLRSSYDTSIIMITHDLGVIAETCEDVIVFYAGQIVEEGNIMDIFHNTSHPYTKGLINAVRSLGDKETELFTIPGTVPVAGEFSKGCRFAERCGEAMAICREKEPELMEISPGHNTRCWLYNGGDTNV